MLFTPVAAAAHYRLVIVGGGTGGCALTHVCKHLVNKGQLAIVEKHKEHHYQAGYTLVGGGMKTLKSCIRPMKEVFHRDAVWLQNYVSEFHPKTSSIVLDDGLEVKYDMLLIAVGLELRYDMVKGLPEAFNAAGLCSIYYSGFVEKTYKELSSFKGGNAIFTFPNTPIKCAGAPQKICYLAEEIFRKRGVRDKTTVMYNTSLGAIFGVKKYAEALLKIVKERSIQLNTRRNLSEVDISTKQAVFQVLDDNAKPTGKVESFEYDLLHVAPPCSPVKALRECAELTDNNGWLDVDQKTLLSKRFDNIFGVGDCMNTANAKTGAAVSSQLRTLNVNIPAALKGKPLSGVYDGYASCPLMVTSRTVILAEFTPDGPMETLPINQAKPRYSAALLKRYFLPILYWHFLVKGLWFGPAVIRKVLHLGFVK